jgi:hypothetical protein
VLGVPAAGRDAGCGGENWEVAVLMKAFICHSKIRYPI